MKNQETYLAPSIRIINLTESSTLLSGSETRADGIIMNDSERFRYGGERDFAGGGDAKRSILW